MRKDDLKHLGKIVEIVPKRQKKAMENNQATQGCIQKEKMVGIYQKLLKKCVIKQKYKLHLIWRCPKEEDIGGNCKG